MMSEENYRFTIERHIYGLPEGLEWLRGRIRSGDRLVVYVIKRGCKELCRSFVAVLEVVSEWKRSTGPTWPDEVRENRVLYPWIVNVRVVAEGKIEFDSVRNEISKILGINIENPQILRGYMQKELPSDFGKLIEERLRTTPRPITTTTATSEPAQYTHDALVNMVRDIGVWLDFDVRLDYRIDNFIVDVAFFRRPREGPLAVVEVHVGGDMFKDLSSLKHAYDRFGSKLIYIVARDEDKVISLVNEALEGAFHEIERAIIILRARELIQLHRALEQENTRRLIKELTRI